MKTILITGGAGFIGSNFLEYFLNKYIDYFVINLDKLTYAGNPDNLKNVSKFKNYRFIKGDICDKGLVESIFKEFSVKGVIHFAAESHVDNSIEDPGEFIKTNVIGTFNLINAAKNFWMESPFKYKNDFDNSRFHHVSTDEVYGSLYDDNTYFTEDTPYAPNSPYSASKASSDHIVRSYNKTYGLNTVITNCSNNYGPKQHSEKLIPTIIRNAISGNPIPIYGDGKNVRDWLYVQDHCECIDIVFHNGKSGETYNIGSNNEKENLEIARLICSILDEIYPNINKSSYASQISFVKDRPGHDRRYAIDSKKVKRELGWQEKTSFIDGLKKTIKWYLPNKSNI